MPANLTLLRFTLFALVCAFSSARAQNVQATTAPLLTPTSLAFDASGVLYLAETGRNVIDRVDLNGNLSVFAGNAIQGFAGDNGPATAAELDAPRGLALDSAGNLYLADTHNHRIRRIDPFGVITTIAGNGSPGFSGDGAQASAASLAFPTALALDSSGNLFLADSGNHRIRRIALSSGIIATVAGNGIQGSSGDNGPATSASLDTPRGIVADASGNLFLADAHNGTVRRIDASSGIITTLAPGTVLNAPEGISLDAAGNILVAERRGERILRIAPDGTVITSAGTGQQGFAGDNGPATSALLNSPRATAISPAGLLTLADTANQRIRQVDNTGTIRTLGGVASPNGILTLSGPNVVQYGTGTLTASMSSATATTGSISFLALVNGSTTLLGAETLTSNIATLSTASLPAGIHRILATYPGDSTHNSAESTTFTLTVDPAPLVATPAPVSLLYGQTPPSLTGALTGLLPQDIALVTTSFTSAAVLFSSPGTYPISASLSGPSASNYLLQTAPAAITITQAPTSTILTPSTLAAPAGSPITLTAQTIPAAQGHPTGRIVFAELANALGSNSLGSVIADATGSATLSPTLAAGTHSIRAVYSGDTNFLPSTSTTIAEVISPVPVTPPDFTLASNGSSQTVVSGAPATFSFTTTIQNGPLNSPILLTASGLPTGASATFNPTYLPPGGAVPSFTLTVQTAEPTVARLHGHRPEALASTLLAFLFLPCLLRKRRPWILLTAVCAALASFGITGCGDRIAALPASTTRSATYTISVTGTSTLPSGAVLQHTANVSLNVQQNVQ